MPAALKISLTTKENQTLQELEVSQTVPRRTKQRATALRLNAKGWKVKAIADYLEWAESTVRETIHRWNKCGLVGLWEAKGRGQKPRWTEEDWQVVERWLNEPHSSSARQLSQRLAKERQVILGAETCSSYTQKKKWRWKRLRSRPPAAKNQEFKEVKKRDLELLKLWAKQGLITLLYLDESGCCPQSPLSYGYGQIGASTARRTARMNERGAGVSPAYPIELLHDGWSGGQQKSIYQKTRKGRRVNIMGVWEEKKRFEYTLKVGTYKAKSYLRFMNWQAERAMKRFFETGKPTVIIHDNASIHRSKLVKKQHQIWSKQGLSVFFLPPYSPEMNRIEEQWLHLKRQELGGYVFEDEYDLAKAIIKGIENRGQQGNYAVERLMFN